MERLTRSTGTPERGRRAQTRGSEALRALGMLDYRVKRTQPNWGGDAMDERGDAWEHDPGPTAASGWAALFAETPNYRGLGRAVLGREAFRWHHGPMFYRGRLDGSAKVLVVGQIGRASCRGRRGGAGGQ